MVKIWVTYYQFLFKLVSAQTSQFLNGLTTTFASRETWRINFLIILYFFKEKFYFREVEHEVFVISLEIYEIQNYSLISIHDNTGKQTQEQLVGHHMSKALELYSDFRFWF